MATTPHNEPTTTLLFDYTDGVAGCHCLKYTIEEGVRVMFRILRCKHGAQLGKPHEMLLRAIELVRWGDKYGYLGPLEFLVREFVRIADYPIQELAGALKEVRGLLNVIEFARQFKNFPLHTIETGAFAVVQETALAWIVEENIRAWNLVGVRARPTPIPNLSPTTFETLLKGDFTLLWLPPALIEIRTETDAHTGGHHVSVEIEGQHIQDNSRSPYFSTTLCPQRTSNQGCWMACECVGGLPEEHSLVAGRLYKWAMEVQSRTTRSSLRLVRTITDSAQIAVNCCILKELGITRVLPTFQQWVVATTFFCRLREVPFHPDEWVFRRMPDHYNTWTPGFHRDWFERCRVDLADDIFARSYDAGQGVRTFLLAPKDAHLRVRTSESDPFPQESFRVCMEL